MIEDEIINASETSESERQENKVPYWHLLPFAVFVIINGLIWAFFWPKLNDIQSYLTPFNLVFFALATYRIANIVSNEQVLKVLRAPFVNVHNEQNGEETETPKPRGIKNTVGTLLYCPSCVGVWAGALIVYLMVFSPTAGWVTVAIFALSALERVLTNAVAVLDRFGH